MYSELFKQNYVVSDHWLAVYINLLQSIAAFTLLHTVTTQHPTNVYENQL